MTWLQQLRHAVLARQQHYQENPPPGFSKLPYQIIDEVLQHRWPNRKLLDDVRQELIELLLEVADAP